MSAFVIFLMILTGIILLILEFFVIPGFTIAGVGGFLLIGAGIFFAYKTYGATAGHLTVLGTLGLFALTVHLSIRNKVWKRMALHTSIDSKVEIIQSNKIHIGDVGVAISRLNPMGKARINGEIIEAHCPGHFVNQDEEVVVTKVFQNYVVVKPKETV